jgi:hypothetical protein
MTDPCACGEPAITTRTIIRFGVEWDHENDRPLGPGREFAEVIPMCRWCAEARDEIVVMGRHA